MPTLELQLVMKRTGQSDYGSGFLFAHEDRTWLITCQHNLESGDPLHLTGALDCEEIRIRRPFQGTISTRKRTVVSAKIGDVIVDCAAVEVFSEDLPANYVVPSKDMALPYENAPPVGLTLLVGSDRHAHNAQPDRQLLIEGYADGATGSIGLRTYRCAEFSFLEPVKPFMLSFHPGATHGISGGPVIEQRPDGKANYVAIYTHNAAHDLQLDVGGHAIAARVETGAGVPLGLLLRAITLSRPNIAQIVDLPEVEGPARS